MRLSFAQTFLLFSQQTPVNGSLPPVRPLSATWQHGHWNVFSRNSSADHFLSAASWERASILCPFSASPPFLTSTVRFKSYKKSSSDSKTGTIIASCKIFLHNVIALLCLKCRLLVFLFSLMLSCFIADRCRLGPTPLLSKQNLCTYFSRPVSFGRFVI